MHAKSWVLALLNCWFRHGMLTGSCAGFHYLGWRCKSKAPLACLPTLSQACYDDDKYKSLFDDLLHKSKKACEADIFVDCSSCPGTPPAPAVGESPSPIYFIAACAAVVGCYMGRSALLDVLASLPELVAEAAQCRSSPGLLCVPDTPA